MACGMKLVGYLLIVFNLLMFILGGALIGVGIWSLIDKVFVADVIGDDLFSAACYMAIVVGVVLLAISIFGLWSTRREIRLYVLIYFISLLVIVVVLLLAAILAVSFKSELEDEMVGVMRTSLVSGYGDDSGVTASWDRLQEQLECCGVQATYKGRSYTSSDDLEQARQDSWLLFQRTLWYKKSREQNVFPVELVPPSCCVFDEMINAYRDARKCQTWQLGPPGNLKFAVENDALFYDGCYEKAKAFLGEQADILVGCGFGFVVLLITGLVLSMMLYRILGQQTRVIKN